MFSLAELNQISPDPSASGHFQASLFVKPHHAESDWFNEALNRKKDPIVLAEKLAEKLRSGKRNSSRRENVYLNDLLGTRDEQFIQFQYGLTRYFTELGNIADNSVIQVDLKPDGVCESCAVGIHCLATNFRRYFEIIDAKETEQRCVDNIRNRLEQNGFQEGQDFIMRQTSHTLFNFLKTNLLGEAVGMPHRVEFNSLAVKAGALRSIL